jgi:hypothetical protein
VRIASIVSFATVSGSRTGRILIQTKVNIGLYVTYNSIILFSSIILGLDTSEKGSLDKEGANYCCFDALPPIHLRIIE